MNQITNHLLSKHILFHSLHILPSSIIKCDKLTFHLANSKFDIHHTCIEPSIPVTLIQQIFKEVSLFFPHIIKLILTTTKIEIKKKKQVMTQLNGVKNITFPSLLNQFLQKSNNKIKYNTDSIR